MITGFNTDVKHADRVFHIQTEDKGLGNPLVESLIYCGGEIIASRRNSYSDLAASGAYSESEVQKRMEDQHQAMIRDIANGRFDTDEPMPFGHNLVSNRSLDEVVLQFLAESRTAGVGPEPSAPARPREEQPTPVAQISGIEFLPLDDQVLHEGTRPCLRFQVLDPDGAPVGGVAVVVTLISTESPSREIGSSTTDDGGFVEISVAIPELPEGSQAIVISGRLGRVKAEMRQLVEKPKRTSQRSAKRS